MFLQKEMCVPILSNKLFSEYGCRRPKCEYLHVTLACDDGQETESHKSFPCYGCKNSYDDETCVVKHKVENVSFYLCLNCNDWIEYKDIIVYPGWSLNGRNIQQGQSLPHGLLQVSMNVPHCYVNVFLKHSACGDPPLPPQCGKGLSILREAFHCQNENHCPRVLLELKGGDVNYKLSSNVMNFV